MPRASTTTLPIVILCILATADGALQLATQYSGLLRNQFPPGLPLVPGTHKISTDGGNPMLVMYDMDRMNYHCDKIQKQRLALLDPNYHTAAIWKLEHAPRSVCNKFHIQYWHRRFSPWDGTNLLINTNVTSHYMRVHGTDYEKEMVLCPAVQYAYPQSSSAIPLQYSIMDGCYFAPSDITMNHANPANPARLVNIFEQDPGDDFAVFYLGIDDQILLTPKRRQI